MLWSEVLNMKHKINSKPHTSQMKFDARQRIVESLHINSDILSRTASVNIIGNNHVHIENYKKIIKYAKDEVIISDKCKKIILSGDCLSIRYFFDGDIDISGIIKSISFEGLYK